MKPTFPEKKEKIDSFCLFTVETMTFVATFGKLSSKITAENAVLKLINNSFTTSYACVLIQYNTIQ